MKQETPRANRLHITLFGKRNSGKSSLINVLTNQNVSLVSNIAGTTTDPVYKSMEVFGVGACVFIDTAGIDDEGILGEMRVKQTYKVIEKTDIALMLCTDTDLIQECKLAELLKQKNIPIIWILNKIDLYTEEIKKSISKEIENKSKSTPILISTHTKQGVQEITQRIAAISEEESKHNTGILGPLVSSGDSVMLVMPQDIQAPKGRLILPQVQTIRELLDKKCLVFSCTTDTVDEMLKQLVIPPKLIITDSQVFNIVYAKKPEESKLTSFSVLFAQYKGDIQYFIEGAKKIATLTPEARILIAEACTHAPQTEDIGKVKIPNMLRKKIGENLKISHVSGNDFPEDLSSYDLIIHCGGCMFNRKHIISRIEHAKSQNVAMTNYGIVIAYMNGILDKISY